MLKAAGTPLAASGKSAPAKAGVSKRPERKNGLSNDQVDEIREAFGLFDTNHNGTIDARELKAAMKALGFELKKDDVKKCLADIGKEVTQEIGIDDFMRIVAPKMPDRDSREEIQKVFKLFVEDGGSFITFRGLKRVCQELGEALTDEEIQEMIDEADRDQDGQISADEFYRVMRKRSGNPLDDWSDDD